MSGEERCKDCSNLPLPGKRRCQSCADTHSAREHERRELRRKKGLCVVCGEPAVTIREGRKVKKMSLCDAHRLAYEVRRAQAKKKRQRARAVTA